MTASDEALQTTFLHTTHLQLDAKMVPFAGYQMPVQYQHGVLKEHLHTRAACGLFDVSHMGQVIIRGPDAARRLERLCTADLEALPLNKQVYSLFTNEKGGILDDLIICRWGVDEFFLVVNAACKRQDIEHLRVALPSLEITSMDNQGLLALQGPQARSIMATLCPAAAELVFMSGTPAIINGVDCYITCSGYTGEDGFEISFKGTDAIRLATTILQHDTVWPIGLGARDSLRLEAGLCLYGHDMNETTTPVEASLSWAIASKRRTEGGFPGAHIILQQLQQGAKRRRAGLSVQARVPVREGAQLQSEAGVIVGKVTSGGFSPCLEYPIAMAYLDAEYCRQGTALVAMVRGKPVPVVVCKTPFLPTKYHR